MKYRLATLFLLLSLFALSANRAWACGSDVAAKCGQEPSEKSCCSKDQVQTLCADGSGHQHSGSDCHCDHDSGSCHCPGCGVVCPSSAAFAPAEVAISAPLLFAASVQRQAFYFAEHLPEAVYLPIWQPPQLGA